MLYNNQGWVQDQRVRDQDQDQDQTVPRSRPR